jgi:hypothetical protein
MGHWTEALVAEAAARLPADVDRDRLLEALHAAGDEIELLTGQSFAPAQRHTVGINSFGLPFVELPGLIIGTEAGGTTPMLPIPNPVDRQRATVVQIGEFCRLQLLQCPSRAR